MHTSQGTGYRIHYRIRDANHEWKQKSETLYDLGGKKEVRSVLDERIKQSENKPVEIIGITFADFVKRFWLRYRDRTLVKLSTRRYYGVIPESSHPAKVGGRSGL